MSHSILIVDDEEGIREGIINALTDPDRMFFEASDGESAINILKNSKIDLLITDLSMPNMNGFELLRKIKMTGQAPTIIVLTGKADQLVANQIRPHGVKHFVSKPWNENELQALITDCLKST